MAKYNVKFSCGHYEEVQLYGKSKDRESRIEYWERNGLCSECYKEEQNKKAAEKSAEQGLPELQGSEKQVTWANKIRLSMIESKQSTINCLRWVSTGAYKLTEEQMVTRAKEQGGTDEQIKEALERIAPYKEEYKEAMRELTEIKSETSAKWFIDNRI